MEIRLILDFCKEYANHGNQNMAWTRLDIQIREKVTWFYQLTYGQPKAYIASGVRDHPRFLVHGTC